MDFQRAICVTVDDSRRIVRGLDSGTTAEDVINVLQGLCKKEKPQVLLEQWNGCSRPLNRDEKICLLLEQWGGQARSVNLIMTEASQFEHSTGRRRISSGRPQAHGKVATKKVQSRHKDRLSKKALAKEVEKLIKMVDVKQAELQSLTTPQRFLQPTSAAAAAGSGSGTSGDQESYPQGAPPTSPEEEEELVALQEQVGEERREHSDLVGRRKELGERTAAQEREVRELKRTTSALQAKISSEERQLPKLRESFPGHPELQEAQREVLRLQNELKVRSKLNQLQSAKMQELSASISRTDQDIQACSKETDRLKLEVNMESTIL